MSASCMETYPHVLAKIGTAKCRCCRVLRHSWSSINGCRWYLTRKCYVCTKDDQSGILFETVFYIVDVGFIQLFRGQIVNHALSIHEAIFICAKEKDISFECMLRCLRSLFSSLQGDEPHQGTNVKLITISDFVTMLLDVEGYKYVKNGGSDTWFSYVCSSRE